MIEGNRPDPPTRARWPLTYLGTMTLLELIIVVVLLLALLFWWC